MKPPFSGTRGRDQVHGLVIALRFAGFLVFGQLLHGQGWAESVHLFSNTTPVSIVDESSGAPYPSSIDVSGLTGIVTHVQISLRTLTHSYPDDIDALLVSPSGVHIMLMSDAGGSFPLNDVTIYFETAGRSLPNSTQITTGTYIPSNWGGTLGDDFAAPAPAGPHSTELSDLEGISPNGVWSLYLRDDVPENAGVLEGGWSLTITVGSQAPPPLEIQLGEQNVRLLWPENFKGFALESRTLLGNSSTWKPITNSVVTTNGHYQVVLPNNASQQFFRLRK